ncbi:endolysin [Mycobacterium phage Krypton555]|uniref:Lysin A n=1 Tax=Mycobacterium phage Krypton555 TaxID=2015885 RepID=A0A222ZRN1_9CAUD|nr:endolysin [Mycobacterium phage Krypton555]ASR87065.1 lysin A [Mycobacterium phage Krypton555]
MPRTVYGNDWSENGWRMIWDTECQWTTIPGTSVSLQIAKGWPLAIMRAFAADFNAYVEPLRDPDSACWTLTNSVGTSNHLSGTAMDLNWNSHPFKIANAGFDAAKIATIRELLAFYESTIFWGNDWTSPKDAMHFQMGYNTYGQARVGDFIARKIRADGFSTFRRGNAPQASDPALILSRATGLTINRAQEILPAVAAGLRQSDCLTPARIAMWLAQCGHESAGFNATEEYESGDESQERWKYKGRTWIQLTWLSAYRGFGQWCYARGLVNDPEVFVKNPKSLADLQWAGLGAAYYWTTTVRSTRKYPTLNEASDARDVLVATQIINGGTNGLSDRQDRYNRAVAVGDDLTLIVNEGDDFLSALSADEQREMLAYLRWAFKPVTGELTKQFPHRSMYAGSPDTDTFAGRAISAHAFGWDYRVEYSARLGEEWAIDTIAQAAAGTLWGVKRDDGSVDQFRVNHAKSVLADLEKNHPDVLEAYLAKKRGGAA